jgi:asparagine N-glycosylation enzyme membrane subunit Stt3
LPLIRLIPPGLVVALFLVLILSAVFYAALPYRRRAYIPILVTTVAGVGLGQLWDFLGLPSLRLGQANLLPAAVFALALQLLARFVPRPRREPKEPKPISSGNTREDT